MYQTISKEYIEFLKDENKANPVDWNQWGEKLFTSWENRGKSSPAVMNSQTVDVGDTLLAVRDDNNNIPLAFALIQNFPNPFNPVTHIEYRISNFRQITLKIYNVLGEELATLVNEPKPAGSYSVVWNAENYSSGIYIYKLSDGLHSTVKKMLLVR